MTWVYESSRSVSVFAALLDGVVVKPGADLSTSLPSDSGTDFRFTLMIGGLLSPRYPSSTGDARPVNQ